MSTKPTVTLDMSGLSCPAPLIGAKKIVDDMEPGQSLLLVSDCPGTSDDLFAWSRQTGNEVAVKDKMADGRTAYLVTRGSGKACLRLRSTVECTATVLMPSTWQARRMRKAISPRLAMTILSNMGIGNGEWGMGLKRRSSSVSPLVQGIHEGREFGESAVNQGVKFQCRTHVSET